METIYADNNATTQVADEVYEAMIPFFVENYFNPSSAYAPASAAAHAISDARKEIAELLGGIEPTELTFTSCATESNNAAIFGAARANPQRRHIVTTNVEHPAVLEVCKEMQRDGYDVTFLPVDGNGNLDVRDFIKSLRSDTLLVTMMHANNETGVVFPIEQFSRLTKETDSAILFHTDATQTVGKLPINLNKEFENVDLLSFSGHKFHAPKGVGALFARRGIPCRPFMIGGHQESGKRGGTENVAYIVGMARALSLVYENRAEEESQVVALRDRLEKSLEDEIPCIRVNAKNGKRLPNTLNVSCHYVEGESMLYQLSDEGICASSGSACTSGSLEPSHVLVAMNIPFTAIHGSIRFSFSRYNTDEDIDRIIDTFPQIVARLRTASPFWDNKLNAPCDGAPRAESD